MVASVMPGAVVNNLEFSTMSCFGVVRTFTSQRRAAASRMLSRRSATAYGSLCESFVHECLKSSLAFRKPAVAVVSRCPARTEGL